MSQVVSGVEVAGVLFPVEHLAGWVELTLLWVCLSGQGLRLGVACCIPVIKNAWPKGNLSKYLPDDLLKENVGHGVWGVSEGAALRGL